MQRVDEMREPPIVGQHYLVPCVKIGDPKRRAQLRHDEAPLGCTGMLQGWWPVVGPQHEDAAIFDFPHEHWHFDLRFLSAAQIANRSNRFWDDKPAKPATLLSLPLTNHKGELGQPELRQRRCHREQPGWDAYFAATLRKNRPPNLVKLERITAIKGQTLKSCKICPHRGLPLGSMPVVDGIITCPGHGLRWNASTGEIVRTPGPVRSQALAREPIRIPLYGDDRRCVAIARARTATEVHHAG